MIHLLSNMLLMLSVLGMASLCGLGFLRLCGLHHFRQRILLAPSLVLAISGILVAVVVVLGIPVGKASPIIWILWIVLAVYGMSCVRSAWSDLDHRYVLLVSILVTLWVSGGFLWYGLLDYLGSPALDGWSYVSFGEYLRQYPKGAEGGLAPIYQYASHLSGTRYVASAMLAVLIPPWGGGIDTQMMVGPLLILSIFSFSLSVAYASQVANQRGLNVPEWLAVFIGVVGGWVPLALHANNYDNLLALHFSPALFALTLDRNLSRGGQILLLAILMAACVYVYPELSPLMIAAYGVAAVEDFFSTRPGHGNGVSKRAQIVKHTAIAIISLMIVSPYLRDAIRFFSQQISTTSQMTGRPGEGIMPSLLDDARIWGAMWGLGNKGIGVIVGVMLGQIALFGAATAVAKKHFSLILYLVLIGILFVVMVALKHYDYGAYKILLLGWWAVAIIVASGAKSIWNTVSAANPVAKKYLKIAIFSVAFVSASLWLTQSYKWVRGYTYKTATATREARGAILENAGAAQVSISDATLNAWLVYQLRDAKALFTEFHGYMDQAHVRPLMARSMVPDRGEIKYILTDVNSFAAGDLIWRNDLFKLVKGTPAQQPPQIDINAPNGREVLGGKPFFWIGRESASIVLTTSKPKVVSVEIEVVAGPSVGASVKDYPLVFVERAGTQLLSFDTQATRTHTVRIALLPGENALVFRPAYAGSVVPNGNGDPRILLVGIKLINIRVND